MGYRHTGSPYELSLGYDFRLDERFTGFAGLRDGILFVDRLLFGKVSFSGSNDTR